MIYDIVIVGAGMAGLTAAIYGARAGKSVLVLEKKAIGGEIITSHKVKNYPGFKEIGGAELMNNVREQVKSLGVEIKLEEVVEIKAEQDGGMMTVKSDEDEYSARAVILAIGREEAKMGVPGEDTLNGISYCATCDGELYKGRTVAVLGGGNTALHEALYLSDIAKKVYVVHRRERFRGDAKLVDELKAKENVELVMGVGVTEFVGEEKVRSVKIKKLGEWIVRPELWDENNNAEIEVDGVFIAVGQRPNTVIFNELVELDKEGYIVAGEDCHTSYSGIYVAGDCRKKDLKQLITAAADGAVAATEAVRNLE